MMNLRFLLLLFSLFPIGLLSAQATIYSQVKIDLSSTNIQTIAELGLVCDHGHYAAGKHLINVFSQSELDKLNTAGVVYEVLIPDAQADYHQRVLSEHQTDSYKSLAEDCNEPTPYSYTTPINYPTGSMGGYLTYAELLENLDSMAAKYPQLITPKMQIGDHTSIEGRPIFYLRLSDNPTIEEEGEPELLYTALHHAREPNSLAQMIFYIWYLLENYGSDPEVTYLVDNTELYFIPCINPDGYVYNEQTDPNGGGLWRKNRRPNDDGSFGVDLNRNYGFEWGFDDFGSSPIPSTETYRGATPFSEPETQAVRDLCNTHNFRITLNYHTFGNLLIYPWGYSDSPTPDHQTFRAFGQAMTRENNYLVGTGSETVGYTVNGDSDDWMYGDSTNKPKIFSLTPEVGPQFWPTPGEIDQLNKSCMKQNLVAAHLLHNYGEVEEIGGNLMLSSLEGSLDLRFKKYGLLSGPITFSVTSADDNITILGNNSFFTDFDHLEEEVFNLSYQIDENTPDDTELAFVINIDNGEVVLSDTLRKQFIAQTGLQTVLVQDSASNLNNWTAIGNWSTTNEIFVSAPSSFTDSPFSTYPPNNESFLRLNSPIDLSEATAAFINFQAQWNIESGYDFVQIMASTDGENWQPLCGLHTKAGSENQEPGLPLYDGIQESWVSEQINLSGFLGQIIYLQFRLSSDSFVQEDGFYFDDFKVTITEDSPNNTRDVFANILASEVAPNPVSGQAFLHLDLQQALQQLELTIYNHLGQSVQQSSFKNLTIGAHQMPLQTNELSAGVYWLHLKADGNFAGSLKLIKVD